MRIGAITKTHGLKGGLKVYPTTDDPAKFAAGQACVLDAKSGKIPVTIKSASLFKKVFIVTFEEFSDINEVEVFKGCDLLVARDDDEELGDDEYYVDDLIGMTVTDEDGQELGTLTEVMVTGANDVYVVTGGQGEILIPAIHDCILSVSVEEKAMRVHLLPGLVQ